jgi:hypothetical protein
LVINWLCNELKKSVWFSGKTTRVQKICCGKWQLFEYMEPTKREIYLLQDYESLCVGTRKSVRKLIYMAYYFINKELTLVVNTSGDLATEHCQFFPGLKQKTGCHKIKGSCAFPTAVYNLACRDDRDFDQQREENLVQR